jgi:hypothetical protein
VQPADVPEPGGSSSAPTTSDRPVITAGGVPCVD